jgi:hypothetical protein
MDSFFFMKTIANTRMIPNRMLKHIALTAISIAIGALGAEPNDFGISKYDEGYVCGVASNTGTLIIKLGYETNVSGVTPPLLDMRQTEACAIRLKVAGDACYSYIQHAIDTYLSD